MWIDKQFITIDRLIDRLIDKQTRIFYEVLLEGLHYASEFNCLARISFNGNALVLGVATDYELFMSLQVEILRVN